MSVLDDVEVLYYLSPRIVRVRSPLTSISIQDLHDTLRDIEDEPANLVHDDLIRTAGKEELGAGVTVGLTSTLRNAKLSFDARKISVSQGTVTTTDSTGVNLIDSGASFVTDGVEPGAWLVNLDDGSVCTVLRVVSQTQLLTDGLGDGSDNEFLSGDAYKIWNVIQCEVNGGNLVAVADDGVTSIDAILPTAGTQVVRTSSSSATLQELADIQYSSFNGGVTVDLTSSYSGTEFPTGTPRQPVNNFSDALDIANARGFTTFFVIGSATIGGTLDFTGKVFYGESETKTTFTIQAGANVQDAEFYEATIQGTLDGGAHVSRCRILNLDYVDGFVQECVLGGTITLGGDAHLLDCWSGDPGPTTPVIDFNNSASALVLRNYNGGITLRNKSGSENVSIDLNSGQIILESTVTDGTITCRGVGKVTDQSTGTTTVVDETLGTTRIAAVVWGSVVDGTITAEQSLRLMNAILGGKVSGAGSGTETFRDPDDTKNRVVATVDTSGNRTAITKDLS